MIPANTVLEAWDKTFETKDFSHLSQYLSEDFQVEYTTGEVDNLEDTKNWCVAGGLRINNFKTCLLYTSPSPRDATLSRMPSSA